MILYFFKHYFHNNRGVGCGPESVGGEVYAPGNRVSSCGSGPQSSRGQALEVDRKVGDKHSKLASRKKLSCLKISVF